MLLSAPFYECCVASVNCLLPILCLISFKCDLSSITPSDRCVARWTSMTGYESLFQVILKLTTTTMNSPASNYKNAVQTEILPSKEQAIVLDAIEGVPIHEYAIALESIIGPVNIRHLSRIVNNQICIYVATKEVAEKLVSEHKYVEIQSKQITIRPLISQNKRLILSNIPPIISNEIIRVMLKESKINSISSITVLRVGLNVSGYQHIISFRRQVYIKPEEIINILSLWKIVYDNTAYHIYPSLDAMLCFNCKEVGYIVKSCPRNVVLTTKETFPPLPYISLPKISIIPMDNTNSTNAIAINSSKRPRSNTSFQLEQEIMNNPQIFHIHMNS